jgi:SAM-dependent methyltransferase
MRAAKEHLCRNWREQSKYFHSRLRRRFSRVLTVEINESVDADCRSIQALPDEFADVVAHYFVLEHVPAVRTFLRDCRRILKRSGFLVCEVPNILLYPDDPGALRLYEHTNHFSPGCLQGWIYFAAPRVPNCMSNSIALENSLRAARLLTIAKIGRAEIACIDAGTLLTFGLDRLKENPWFTAKGPPAPPEDIFRDEPQYWQRQ